MSAFGIVEAVVVVVVITSVVVFGEQASNNADAIKPTKIFFIVELIESKITKAEDS
jgi:hypothetical protein